MLDPGTLIAGSSALSTVANIGSGIYGLFNNDKGPDVTAITANANANVLGGNIASQARAYLALESLMPQIYAFAGYTQQQIASTMKAGRTQLAEQVAQAHTQISGHAWDSGAQYQLADLLKQIGSEKYGYDPAQAQAMPDLSSLKTYDNGGLVSPLDPNKDWREAGGGKFSFQPTELSPEYQFEQTYGQRALDRMLASRGLYNSGAGLEAGARFNEQLIAEETERQYGKQQTEYGEKVAGTQAQIAQQNQEFGNTLAAAGFTQQGQQFGASLTNQGNLAGLQSSVQAGVAADQYTQGRNQYTTGLFQNALGGSNNSLQSGLGTYLNYSNQTELNSILRDSLNNRTTPKFSGGGSNLSDFNPWGLQ